MRCDAASTLIRKVGRPSDDSTPNLPAVHTAVHDDRMLEIAYRVPGGGRAEQCVAPYGLAAKAGAWYLVCAAQGRMRVHRVADLLDARVGEERFERPEGFDLVTFWQGWCAEQEQRESDIPSPCGFRQTSSQSLPAYFGAEIRARAAAAVARRRMTASH